MSYTMDRKSALFLMKVGAEPSSHHQPGAWSLYHTMVVKSFDLSGTVASCTATKVAWANLGKSGRWLSAPIDRQRLRSLQT